MNEPQPARDIQSIREEARIATRQLAIVRDDLRSVTRDIARLLRGPAERERLEKLNAAKDMPEPPTIGPQSIMDFLLEIQRLADDCDKEVAMLRNIRDDLAPDAGGHAVPGDREMTPAPRARY